MTKLPESDYGKESWFARKINREGYKNTGAYYGYSRNGYQRFRHHYLVKLLREEITTTPPQSVLDVGCGVGNFIHHVTEAFTPTRVLGVDFVEPVVNAAAQQFPHIEFRQDSLPNLATIEETFDLIIASEVLYYLDATAQQAAIQRLSGILSANGFLLVSSTLADNAFGSAAELRQLVSPIFSIHREWAQTSRFYLKLMQPFVLAHKVDTAVPSNDWPVTLQQLFTLFQTPILGTVLKGLTNLMTWVSTPVLSSPTLADFLTRLGQFSGSQRAISNVILLLEKRDQT